MGLVGLQTAALSMARTSVDIKTRKAWSIRWRGHLSPREVWSFLDRVVTKPRELCISSVVVHFLASGASVGAIFGRDMGNPGMCLAAESVD